MTLYSLPPIPHRSIVTWPDTVPLGNADNTSTDTHDSKEMALAVVRGIMREGLGGEGKIFPLAVSVEPVDG